MFKTFVSTWKNNHGNKLLLFGTIAAAIVSAITYFNVLPDVRIVEENSATKQLPSGPNLRRNGLVVIITGPARESADSPPIQGSAQVLQPIGKYDRDVISLWSRPFELDRNGYATLTFDMPTIQEYAVACYIDLNGNGDLDFSSKGTPLEPLRLSSQPTSPPTSLSLDNAVISATTPAMMVVHMTFPTDTKLLTGEASGQKEPPWINLIMPADKRARLKPAKACAHLLSLGWDNLETLIDYGIAG